MHPYHKSHKTSYRNSYQQSQSHLAKRSFLANRRWAQIFSKGPHPQIELSRCNRSYRQMYLQKARLSNQPKCPKLQLLNKKYNTKYSGVLDLHVLPFTHFSYLESFIGQAIFLSSSLLITNILPLTLLHRFWTWKALSLSENMTGPSRWALHSVFSSTSIVSILLTSHSAVSQLTTLPLSPIFLKDPKKLVRCRFLPEKFDVDRSSTSLPTTRPIFHILYW